ncbi:MAG: solute carrier family 23 protein [Deltaproteobacteria bacterium]
MDSKPNNLLYEVNENPPFLLALAMGIQHILLVYGEITLLPVIIGKKAGAPMEHIMFAAAAAGLAAGLATLLQVLRVGRVGAGYTLFMGSSAAYLTGSLGIIKAGGFPLLATLSILVVPVELAMGYFLRFLRHIITPAVGGVILLLVVMSLVPLSVFEWVGEPGHPLHASWENFLTGLVTIGVLLAASLFGGRKLRLWCPFIGMAAGLLASWALGLLPSCSFSAYPWYGWFRGSWPGLATDLKLEHLSLFATMAVLTLINGVQAIGNSMAVQQVSHREPRQVSYQVVQGTIYGDAFGNIFSGLLGTVPNETYAENICVLKATGVTSRLVGIFGALMLMALPFSPKLSMALVQLPTPVFGGFLMGMAAMMFPSGLELVFSHGINHRSGLLVGISLCIGMVAESGLFFPDLFIPSIAVFLNNGVAAGGLTAVILSLLFRITEKQVYATELGASLENLPVLMERIQQAGEYLDIPNEQVLKLQLVCEEILLHISDPADSGDRQCLMGIKIVDNEDELTVEISCGQQISDLKRIHVPQDLPIASAAELDRLGLALFRHLITDFRQASLSGVSYIWFTLK